MAKGAFKNYGKCQWKWEPDYQNPEQVLEELWDEAIDFILALREIHNYSPDTPQGQMALTVLKKHGKENPE